MQQRILLVDDDERLRDVVAKYLKDAGYEVLTAGEADDALFLAHMRSPNAIILDARLPDQDGVHLCTMLRGHDDTRGIPLLFIADLDETLDDLRQKITGEIRFVQKPLIKDEVLEALERLLAS